MSNAQLIDGEVSVSGDVHVGGDSTTQGNSTIEKDLKVKGWLDAPNLTGACKGLFASADTLAEAYPKPLPGWFAFVGNTFPADIYRAYGGEWLSTGESYTPTFTTDAAETVELATRLEEAISKAEEAAKASEELMENIKEAYGYFGVDENKDIYIRDGRGFYSESFVSVKGVDAEANS